MFFFFIFYLFSSTKLEGRTGPGGRELAPVGGGRGKMVGGGIRCKKYVHMYVNAKMKPIETVPGIRGGEIKESSGGVNSSMVYLIHCKNLCKCYNVPYPAQQ
jgi:hypothetical protein